MASIFDNLKNKYLEVLNPVKQSLSNVGNSINQSVGFTEGRYNPVAQVRAAMSAPAPVAQQIRQNINTITPTFNVSSLRNALPNFSTPKYGSLPYKALNTLSKVQPLAESFINQPVNAMIQSPYGLAKLPSARNQQQTLADISQFAQGPLTYAGLRYAPAQSVKTGLAAPSLLKAGVKGFAQTAPWGLASGGLTGLQQGENMSKEGQLFEAGKQSIAGGLIAGGFGGSLAVLSNLPKAASKGIVSMLVQKHRLTPQQARDELGRFAKDEAKRMKSGKPPSPKEPVYYGDLREAVGLPRNGRIGDEGFIKLGKGNTKQSQVPQSQQQRPGNTAENVYMKELGGSEPSDLLDTPGLSKPNMSGTSSKMISHKLQPLTEEARKYKTADEFINKTVNNFFSPIRKLYWGSKQKFSGNIGSDGLPTSTIPSVAKSFSKEYGGKFGIVNDGYLDPSAKIIKFEDVPNQIKYSPTNYDRLSKVTQWAKQQGYDAIDATKGNAEAEIRIINPKAILTQEQLNKQLTNIWNKAISVSQIKGMNQKGVAQNLPVDQTAQPKGVQGGLGSPLNKQLPKIGQLESQTLDNSGSGISSNQRPSGTIIPPGQKERQFINTVREADLTKPQVVGKVQGTYTPITNKRTLTEAQQIVNQGYEAAKQRVADEPLSAQTNAIGQEVMRQAQNAGRYDEAASMAETLAIKGTQAGQSVQAFSIWSKMTPEGMLRYAQQQILKVNKESPLLDKAVNKILKRPEVKLTPEDSKFITEMMKRANKAGSEEEQAMIVKKVMEHIGKKLPWGVSDLLDSYRYNNMLSNPLTHLRNVWSNLMQTYLVRPATLAAEGRPIEAIKYEIGAIKSLPNAFANATKAFKEGTPLGRLDQTDIGKLRPIKPNRLGFLNIPSQALEAGDQFFKTIIKGGELARGNSIQEAEKMADYTLFRADLHPQAQGFLLNKIDDVTKAIYGLRRVGLGWFIPFIRTPMNVAKQWIEYSPAGLATIPGSASPRTQLAKTALGSIATAFGANMALEGRTTWQAPTDPLQKKLFYDSGRKPYSIKVGDKWVPMQTLGVFAWAVGIPAAVKYYQEDSRTALSDSQLDKLVNIAASGLGFWTQQTFVSGLGGFIQLAQGNTDYTLAKNLGYTVSQLKPWNGLMRYVSTAIDPVFRKPKDLGQQLISDIPVLTKSLPAYETTFGEPATRNITNYIAPYGMGQENPEYEDLYQQRGQQLQFNSVLNEQKKTLLNEGKGSIIDAGAAETNPESASPQTQKEKLKTKMQEAMVKQSLELGAVPKGVSPTTFFIDGEDVQGYKVGDKFIYENQDGGISSRAVRVIKKQQVAEENTIRNSQYTLDAQRAQRAGDYQAWQKASDTQLKALQDYQKTLDPVKDKAKINSLQNQIEDLQVKIDKYKGYGGFKKGRKPKKISFKGIKPLQFKLAKAKAIKVRSIKPKRVKVYAMNKTKKLNTKVNVKLT